MSTPPRVPPAIRVYDERWRERRRYGRASAFSSTSALPAPATHSWLRSAIAAVNVTAANFGLTGAIALDIAPAASPARDVATTVLGAGTVASRSTCAHRLDYR